MEMKNALRIFCVGVKCKQKTKKKTNHSENETKKLYKVCSHSQVPYGQQQFEIKSLNFLTFLIWCSVNRHKRSLHKLMLMTRFATVSTGIGLQLFTYIDLHINMLYL
ncbi:hypothetical protein GQX74_015180 [Glossina fuscipes]|nr:hypothetical protein GQX74_015180 [Glossina fuscipes]